MDSRITTQTLILCHRLHMIYTIVVTHPDISFVKFVRGQQILHESPCCVSTEVPVAAADETLSIWFEPWTIKPVIRIDGVMINYALAGIDHFDHKIDFVLDSNFNHRYHHKDIEFRVKTVFADRHIDEYVFDSVIGHGRMHQDILQQIKKLIL